MRYFSFLLFVILLIAGSGKVFAKDLGVHGQVWRIQEKNIISYIKERLQSQDIQKINSDFRKKVKQKVNRPDPVEGITKTLERKVHFFNPEITLKRDIVDHTGRILHKKGKKVNPLDYQEFDRKLLFINGDDQQQVDYALMQHKEIGEDLKIVLVDGSPIELMKKNKMVRFFFDQSGYLSQTFGINTVPSMVSKEGKLLRIESIVVEEKR